MKKLLILLLVPILFSCAAVGKIWDCQVGANDNAKDMTVRMEYWMENNICEYKTDYKAAQALLDWLDGQVDIVCYAYGRCMKDIGHSGGQKYWQNVYYEQEWESYRNKVASQVFLGMANYRKKHCD